MPERFDTRAKLDALKERNADEDYWIDFKGDANVVQWWELAKDVAAFANTFGGVLLVGVSQADDRAITVHGLPRQRIADIRTEYENTVRDKVSPKPMVTYEQIPIEDGREVLAVHVEPYIAGLVGSMFYSVNDNGKKETSNAWQFPIRQGAHNVALSPDQFPLYMEPRLRRTIVLLETVRRELEACTASGKADQCRVRFWMHAIGPMPMITGSIMRFEVDVPANTLRAEVVIAKDPPPIPLVACVPLDAVGRVWQRWAGVWQIHLDGSLIRNGNQLIFVEYGPPAPPPMPAPGTQSGPL